MPRGCPQTQQGSLVLDTKAASRGRPVIVVMGGSADVEGECEHGWAWLSPQTRRPGVGGQGQPLTLVQPALGPSLAVPGRCASGLGCVDIPDSAQPCKHGGHHGALLGVKWL